MAQATHLVTVAIPTWRRPELLRRLLGELDGQSVTPDRLIVVDGEGGARAVRDVLAASGWPSRTETLLIPASRPNLPFQRWLARRKVADADALVFFDDDVLLPNARTLELLSGALGRAAAATCQIRMSGAAAERFRWRLPFGRLRAGRLSAGGSRHMPRQDSDPLPRVEWLRGGAMAIRAGALAEERFPRDLFALAEHGAGMGEELALALCIRGPIVLVRGLEVEHPGGHGSLTLPADGERQGFAVAYSRRLLHDLRQGSPAGLAAAWAVGLAAAAADCVASGGAHRSAFLRGYARGVAEGALRPPTHARLTPSIDWEREAAVSLAGATALSEEVRCARVSA